MDLDEIKEFWKARPIFHDEYGVIEATEWLIAEVERLKEAINIVKATKYPHSYFMRLEQRFARAEAERDRYKAALQKISVNGWPLEMRNIALQALAEDVRG